jgi:hypothetical protein
VEDVKSKTLERTDADAEEAVHGFSMVGRHDAVSARQPRNGVEGDAGVCIMEVVVGKRVGC